MPRPSEAATATKLGRISKGSVILRPVVRDASRDVLNELLKEHRKVQEQANTIAELKDEIANLKAIVKDQTTQIQKVTAQVESTEAAVRIAVNHH